MDKRFHIKPYTFRGKLLMFLLLSALAACTISAAGSFMVNVSTLNNDLEAKEHEVAVYLLGLEQKTSLLTEEMLAVTANDTLNADVAEHPEWVLSADQLARMEKGELITTTSGFIPVPVTYVQLGEDVVSIRPSHDFNLILSILPRFAFTILLTMVLFALLSILVSFTISKPVTQLTQATQQIKDGDFTVRLPDNKQGEMGELMRSFNSMTEELGKIAYLQKDFISSISHEFRTPIASIKGFARLLQMPGLDESARQEYVGMIAQESERLSNLSNTLLRLSALERQMAPAALSTFRLDEQVRQVILQLQPAWSAKEIDWQLNLDEVTIESDADLLIQVWINLIQNAVKFSESGSSIDITVMQTDMAEFTIRDHGIGMDEETLSRIFDRFYQADSSRSKEGVGLGLCLVKRIVDMLGGQIRVHSTPGEGSTFRLRIPLSPPTHQGGHHDANHSSTPAS